MPRFNSFSKNLLGIGLGTPPFTGDPQLWAIDSNTAAIVDFTRNSITSTNSTIISKTNPTIAPIRDKLFGEAAMSVQNGAIQIDGGDLINFNNWLPLYGSNEWTIEYWFQYEGPIGGNLQALCYISEDTNGRLIAVFFDASGKILFMDPSSGVLTTSAYNDGLPHHIVIQKIGNTLMCWIDGQDKVIRTLGSGYTTSTSSSFKSKNIRLGNYLQPDSNISYYIDAIRISNIARYPNTTTITAPSNPF